MSQPERPPIPPIHPLRLVWQPLVGWGLTLVFTTGISLASILTLGRFSYWITPTGLRWWGRTMLKIQGVKLEVTGAERFADARARVATFNHTSSLDAMIIPAITPPGATVAIKREVLYIPFVGLATWCIGFLLLDRGRSERAKAVLARAAQRLQQERLTVFIAPEGTRSKDGSLQDFKRGAFYLAQASGAPIAPVVICDSWRLHPRGARLSRQGTLRVHLMEPIETAGLTVEQVPAFADEVRAVYLRELERLRAAPDPGPRGR